MSVQSSAEDRAWAGEKREFVADSRDDAADERDLAADARDVIAGARDTVADAREAQLDKGETQLEANATELGLAVGGATAGTDEQGQDRATREAAHEERTDQGLDPDVEKVSRDAAPERREDDDRPTLLALAFASIAEQLYDADTYEVILTRIAAAAVATVAGGQ